MKLISSAGKWIKEHVLLTVLASVLVSALSGGAYWVLNTFEDGLEAKKKAEFSKFFNDELTAYMTSPEKRDVFVKVLVQDTNVVAMKDQASKETQKAIVELTQGDSVNLRKELRLYMDLRESEKVAPQIGWIYKQLHRLPFIVDSIFDSKRVTTPHH